MTRIALLPSSYPPSLGGVEELTRHLALALVEGGDQVEVWTLHPDDAKPETVEIRDGLVVRRLPMPMPATNWTALGRTAATGPRTLFSLRSAVDAFRPDVLHVQCFGPNGAYATALSHLTGIPLVVTLQGETMMDDTDIFEISTVLRASLRRAIKRAAAVTACSAFTLADAERRFGLPVGEGMVIFNGVKLDVDGGPDGTLPPFTPVPDDPDRPYVLGLGRVVEKKGFDLLLRGYAAMAPDRRTADLVIGGAGAALEGLEALAHELGIAEQVHFVGRLDRDQVASAMAGATVFVMPSRLEPFGIVLLEAWRAGVAVVATTWGGPPEFVTDGVDGVLVDPFDADRVAAALSDLLADADRRRAIAAAGRRRVQAFGWPTIADEYRAVYRSVMRGGTAPSPVGAGAGAAGSSGSGTSPGGSAS
jgi:glycosyltransferase involved in cell wall biosynthesis